MSHCVLRIRLNRNIFLTLNRIISDLQLGYSADMSFLGRAFGRVIKERRKELGVSQAAFADAIGVEPPTASKWETGASLPINDRIDKILEVLDLSADEFLNRLNESKPVNHDEPTLTDAIEFLNAYDKAEPHLRRLVLQVLNAPDVEEIFSRVLSRSRPKAKSKGS